MSPDLWQSTQKLLSLFHHPSLEDARKAQSIQTSGGPRSTSVSAEKQDPQVSKCPSSVATSTVTVQGQVPANGGGIESLRQSTQQPSSVTRSPTGNKSPMSPRRMRAMNDLRGIPFFRGFRGDYEEEAYQKLKAEGSPF